MLDLDRLQTDVRLWSDKNFGDQPAYLPLLGIPEEVGELCHAYLKLSQNIRMDEDHKAKLRDALGDIIIYLCDFSSRMDISLSECIDEAWTVVQKRDWTSETLRVE